MAIPVPSGATQFPGYTPVVSPQNGMIYYIGGDGQVYSEDMYHPGQLVPDRATPESLGIDQSSVPAYQQASSTSTGTSFVDQVQSLYDRLGVQQNDSSDFLSADQLTQAFQANGVDTSNPAVMAGIKLAAQAPDLTTQSSLITNLSRAYSSPQYQVQQGSYQQEYDTLGVANLDTTRNKPSNVNIIEAVRSGHRAIQPEPDHVAEKRFVQTQDGHLYFTDGVIVNPNDPTSVMYDPQQNAPGSPTWMRQAQRHWSPTQVQNWRTELFKMGYLSSKKGGGGWDYQLIGATQKYYQLYYANGGQPLAYSAAGPGGTTSGPTGSPPLDLHELHGSIQSQVQQQYQSVFGQDPTNDELKSWTQFIINTGMQLQQGGAKHQLSPDAALQEAEARAAKQITNSPEASTWTRNQQENTQLHDALTSAISAYRGLG